MIADNPSGPVGSAFMGVTNASGEPGLIVMMEEPQRAPGFVAGVPRDVLERLHLERFRFDHLARRGVVPFEGVERGGDPPDFIVATALGREQLDCAILANEGRRKAHHLFGILRERLFAGAEGRTFDGIAGTLVGVSFGPHLDELPPRRTDDSIVTPLLDALAEANVDREAHSALMESIAQLGGFPGKLPPGVVTEGGTRDHETSFVANIVYPVDQIPPLPGGLPFMVQLHFPHQVTRSEVESELQRLVTSHDKSEIEHLLVSAGAPNPDGTLFPAEEAFARLLVEAHTKPVSANHIRKVSLHLWGGAEVFDVPVSQ